MSRDEKLRHFPDMGTLVDFMNRARANGDEELRAQYNEMYERAHGFSDGWYTNIPLLASVVATARPGPVLEIGVGRGSSSLLVELCRAMGRDLVGLDSDASWLLKMADLEYPTLIHMPSWDDLPAWLEGPPRFGKASPWSVIFIDHGPGEARLPVLKMVRGYSEHVVIHDTFNPGYLPGLEEELDTWKFRANYTLMPSCTSVVSDVTPYAGAR